MDCDFGMAEAMPSRSGVFMPFDARHWCPPDRSVPAAWSGALL